MRALTFSGILHDDGRFDLEPGFVLEAELSKGEGELEVVVTGRGGKPLATTRLTIDTPCAIPGDSGNISDVVRSSVGVIAFPKGATQLSVLHEGKVVLERRAPRAAKFKIDWLASEKVLAGHQAIRWQASTEGCVAALGYSNDGGKTWNPVSLPYPQGEIPVNMDTLAGGDNCLFELIATDGFTTTRFRSDPFVVEPKGWVLWILSPVSNAIIESGDTVSLVAQGYHFEERKPGFEDIHWTSSVDGGLGIGAQLLATLTPGEHRITASMYGVSSEVVITVNK